MIAKVAERVVLTSGRGLRFVGIYQMPVEYQDR